MRIDVVNRLLHGSDLFGLFVGDLGLEFVFERHDQFDHVERIGTEVVKEGGLVLDLGFVHAKLFSDDLLDALFDAFHADLQLGKIPRIIAKRRGMQTPGRDKNNTASVPAPSGPLSRCAAFPQKRAAGLGWAAPRASHYCIYMPPLTCSVVPVM
ncbi:Uncharacterised protein [Bordetella pertussis]|nr:Uncharacterised protein [Bordetella pertussis]